MYTRIRELREDTDRKQIEIAKLLGITQAQYSRIETGHFQLDYENLTKLAIFYNTSIDYLLGLTNQKLPYPRANLSIKK